MGIPTVIIRGILESGKTTFIEESLLKINANVMSYESDTTLNIDAHSTRLVSAMQGLNVNYIKVPFREHCDLSGEAKVEYDKAVLKAFEE